MHQAHATALNAKHAGLETKIDAEMQRPSPDHGKIADLKRQKLKIKEQLQTAPAEH